MANTPITGNTGFVAVGFTMQLNNAGTGTWSSSDVTIATVDSKGLVTGVSQGSVNILFTLGDSTVYTAPITVLATTYTNGFDISRILPVMIGRKGWKQPTQSDFTPVLNSINTSCSSFRYYNQDHWACDAYNLWNVQNDAGISSDNFNTFLTDLQVGVVMNALNMVFRQPSVIEEPQILFEKQFRTQWRPIPNASKFCGWQLKPADGDYTTKIDSVQLITTAPCTITLYCYNDLIPEALYTRQFTITEGYKQTIFNLEDFYISRQDDIHKGGMFYCGYYQDELANQGVQAVDVYLTWWSDPKMFAYQAFEAVSNYMDKTFVRWAYYSNWKTYGIGLEVSTWWNFTNTIIRDAHEFDNLIGLLMIQKGIELTMQSTRSSLDQRISQSQMDGLYAYLEGIMPVGKYRSKTESPVMSVRGRIEDEVKRIRKTFFPDNEAIFTIPPVADYGLSVPAIGHIVYPQ